MFSWIDVASLAVSIITGASAALQQIIQKHPGLSVRMQILYADALKRWSSNKGIREHWARELHSAEALANYISTAQTIDPEINSLLKIWVDKLLGDGICGPFVLDAYNAEARTAGLNEILASIKAPYNTIYDASSDLRSYFSDIVLGYHINRQETDILYSWLSKPADPDETPEDRVAVLLAGAGLGKTVILHDLLIRLEQEGTPVLGIKSDIIFDSSDSTIDKALNLGSPVASVIKEIALDQKVVILIDQIDALSAVLSADRRPLASITAFINEITRIPNVRVIVSCRQYDFDYESAFERYKHCERVRVQDLSEENVIDTLHAVGIDESSISDTVKSFLRSPLNLFLYCRLADRSQVNSSPTLQDLYSSLWREIIIDKAGFDTVAIIKCLDQITSEMSRRQVLTLNTGILPSETAHQRGFLISNSFLNEVGHNNIQFIHQTLFEYTAARLFVERGRTLDELFLNKHQGLFLRPQLKQILDYQRNVDPQAYITNVRHILFAKDRNGKDKYRFQLKQLIITTLAYYPTFLESEKAIVRQLLQNKELSPILLSAISTADGIELLWEYICENGGVQAVDRLYLKSYLNAVCIVGLSDTQLATEYLAQVTDVANDEELRQQFVWALDSLPIGGKTSSMLWTLIKEYGSVDGRIEVGSLLNRLIKYDPKSVGDYLLCLLEGYVKDNKSKFSFDVPHSFETIVEHIQNENKDAFLPIALQMLDIILVSSEEFKGDDIRSAAVFLLFNRRNTLHFDDWLLVKLMDTVEEKVERRDAQINQLLCDLSSTDSAAKHIIALVGWKRDVPRYKEQIYNYLIDNLGKKIHASYLEFLQLKVYESVIPILGAEQQGKLIKKINTVEPDWERVHFKGEGRAPLLKVGYTKAQFWGLVPEDILKQYPKEYKEYQTLRRKYKDITVHEPNRIRTMTGWTSTPESKVDKMSKKDLIKLAQTHDKDSYLDWDRPTRHGNAQVFSSRASREPDFMCDVYSSMLDEDTSLSYFVVRGLEGLRSGHCEESRINALLKKLIGQLPNDVNAIDPEISFGIIRDTDSYIKANKVPPRFLFDFLVNVALTAKDDEKPEREQVDVNDGINELRGSAVDSLVQLHYCKDYTDQLFDVLTVVAETGSVATRCALLFQMALLLHVDRALTLQLFLKAVSRDYNVNLLRMPLHDLNPLVYFAKTDFDALRTYFEECIKRPASHQTNIVILFASWMRNTPGAEELTYRMADSSVEAKFHLIRYICKVYSPVVHEKCLTVLIKYINSDENNLGRAYDEIAATFGRWSRANLKKYLATYFASSASRYAAHYMTDFLKSESRKHPEDCLKWISALYRRKFDSADRYSISEYTQILIEAYNSICKYDSQSPVLEEAMDMFDELLRENIDNRPLSKYLKEVG